MPRQDLQKEEPLPVVSQIDWLVAVKGKRPRSLLITHSSIIRRVSPQSGQSTVSECTEQPQAGHFP